MTYDVITHKGGLTHVRERPGMYVGDYLTNGYNSALMNMLREAIGNSVDEFMNGFATKIIVRYLAASNHICVTDDGRGIPFGPTVYVDAVTKTESPIDKLMLATGVANTGAKYNKGDGKSFKFAIGMNGIGIKAVNALSDEFIVQSVRDGTEAMLHFTKGEPDDDGVLLSTADPAGGLAASFGHGTSITWKPDATLLPFQYDVADIRAYLQEVAYLNAGLRIELWQGNDESKREVFYEPEGLTALAAKLVGQQKMLVNFPLLTGSLDTGSRFEIILKALEGNAEVVHAYVNGATIETASAPVAAARQSYGRALTALWKDHPKIKKLEKLEIRPDDLRSGLVAIVKILHVDPAFDSQTKTKLVNTDIATAINLQLPNLLKAHLLANPKELEAVFAQAVVQAQAREAADKARDAVRKMASNLAAGAAVSLDIYTPPLKHDPSKNMLYMSEGQSAAGSITKAAKHIDPTTGKLYKEHIGNLALRGSVLNTLEQTLDRAMQNKELATLIKVSGLNPANPSDLSGLNFDKFVIATDMDAGGAHIATLLVSFFLAHFPEVIRQGKLYRVITPLFELEDLKTRERKYIYPDEDRQEGVKRHGYAVDDVNKRYTIKRNKGLGEMSDACNLTLVANPRLQAFKTDDLAKMRALYDVFSGSKHVEARRELIFTLGVVQEA